MWGINGLVRTKMSVNVKIGSLTTCRGFVFEKVVSRKNGELDKSNYSIGRLVVYIIFSQHPSRSPKDCFGEFAVKLDFYFLLYKTIKKNDFLNFFCQNGSSLHENIFFDFKDFNVKITIRRLTL